MNPGELTRKFPFPIEVFASIESLDRNLSTKAQVNQLISNLINPQLVDTTKSPREINKI